MTVVGTSRHFVAMRNLVATGGIADIGQARTNRVRFIITRPNPAFANIMARLARVVLASHPHHVTQRGNGRARTFFGDSDYSL
jgi:hypothetical protein